MIEVSVIIPTHNRVELLAKHLVMLGAQSVAVNAFEVIVVADGCTDNTVAVVRQLNVPYKLTLIEVQRAAGAAAARNRGAAASVSDILLFLDDDVEPARHFVRAHLDAHRRNPGGVVVGDYPIEPTSPDSLFAKTVRLWWADRLQLRHLPDHRYTMFDFCTGNLSIARAAFEDAGGFDENIGTAGAGEDYELGYRLLRDRIPFRLAVDAESTHCTSITMESYFARARAEGFGQAIISLRHPELFWEFNLAHLSRLDASLMLRPIWVLLWKFPRLSEPPAVALRLLARLLIAIKVHSLFWKVHNLLRGHAYWQGARSALGTLSALERLAQDAPHEPIGYREVDLEVNRYIHDLDEFVSENSPIDAVRIFARGEPVGRIPPCAPAEALKPQHIRKLLVRQFSSVLLSELIFRSSAPNEGFSSPVSAAAK